MRTLSIDIETYSSVDLAKSGVYRYCQSPDFEILLFGYSIDGNDVQVISLAYGESIPADVLDALTDDTIEKWAWNANFERVCLSRWLDIDGYLNPQSWRCSMVWAATLGLPLSLEGAGVVLGLEKQKLVDGKRLIRKFCTPPKPTQLTFGEDSDWELFKDYNRRDVEVEMAVKAKLANFPVSDEVWEQYILDQQINDRGVALDMTLVKSAIAADKRSHAKLIGLYC